MGNYRICYFKNEAEKVYDSATNIFKALKVAKDNSKRGFNVIVEHELNGEFVEVYSKIA